MYMPLSIQLAGNSVLWLILAIILIMFILFKDKIDIQNLTKDKFKTFLYILIIVVIYYFFIYL